MNITFRMRSDNTTEDMVLTKAWDAALNKYAQDHGLDYHLKTDDHDFIRNQPYDVIWKHLYANSTLRDLGYGNCGVDIDETEYEQIKQHFGVEE